MRENRTSGSEGGGTEQSVLPTPIILALHNHFSELVLFSRNGLIPKHPSVLPYQSREGAGVIA